MQTQRCTQKQTDMSNPKLYATDEQPGADLGPDIFYL